ncbi:MAG: murein biosynthesis integral membrane protein MurJ [Deltaproteobacteria bacterium RBG_13_49_15]|nr:MAG: murein biosynthesis integral membrane protein MurJ [Deltaproteobacteria bacterium RBG_13_49_15]
MKERVRFTRAAGVVGSATLLSRIFGFLRDMMIAWVFGAGAGADAFFVAFRIPNLLRRLLAEGSLSVSFIPVFTEYLANQGQEEAFRLARSAVKMLSILLLVVVVLGIIFSPAIVRIIAPGFAGSTDKLSLTISLTRIMFPYIFFIALMALGMGILNTLGHFAAPAAAPALLSITMIASIYLISPHFADPITGLAIGVLFGGALQLSLQIPFILKKGIYTEKKTAFYHTGLKKIGQLMVPTIFGAAVYQVNILVGTLLASLLPEGSVSFLYYADRLVQFPLGIFAIAIATAVLPSLSRQAAAGDIDGLKDTFSHAMKLVSFITLPSMAGLIILREPIIAVLFKRGAFDARSTQLTAEALLYYSIGLWAFSAVRVVVSTFYALQDTRTPVRTAFIAVIANILFGVILMRFLNHGGLALATSLSSMLNLALLMWSLRVKLGSLKWREMGPSIMKSSFCSIIMGAVLWTSSVVFFSKKVSPGSGLLLGLIGTMTLGIMSYVILSYLLKNPELSHLFSMAQKSLKKGEC